PITAIRVTYGPLTRLGSPVRPLSPTKLRPMALYASYGSNMDPGQMLERCPYSPAAGTGWIEGWRLTFGAEDVGWDGALATLVEEFGSRVFVALYDITPYDEARLDTWEAVDTGLYQK